MDALWELLSTQEVSLTLSNLPCVSVVVSVYPWFKVFFYLVSILLATVPDYGNEYRTKENKN